MGMCTSATRAGRKHKTMELEAPAKPNSRSQWCGEAPHEGGSSCRGRRSSVLNLGATARTAANEAREETKGQRSRRCGSARLQWFDVTRLEVCAGGQAVTLWTYGVAASKAGEYTNKRERRERNTGRGCSNVVVVQQVCGCVPGDWRIGVAPWVVCKVVVHDRWCAKWWCTTSDGGAER